MRSGGGVAILLFSEAGVREGDAALAHFRVLVDAAAQRSASPVRSIGDGLLVTFNSVVDALSSAVALHNDVRARALGLRTALHVGDAITDEADYFSAPVVAIRHLSKVAQEGGIVATATVAELAGNRSGVSFGPTREIHVETFGEPVAVCDVDWSAVTAPRPPHPVTLPAFAGGPFVGRHDELGRLLRLLKEMRAGDRRSVFLGGEPGIGKTRLAIELAQRAQELGSTVLYGRCEEGMGVAYQPFIEALGAYAERAPQAVLDAHVRVHGGELTRIVPELRRRVPDAPMPAATDADMARYRLLESVRGLVASACADNPVALVIDDLHAATTPTVLMLRHLVRADIGEPLLFVGTYRTTDIDPSHPLAVLLADLAAEPSVTRIVLPGLGADDVARCLAQQLGDDEPDAALVQAVHSATDGNPLFVTELAAELASTGVDGDAGFDALNVPESVRELIGTRLSRLSALAGRALAVAAVVGRDFDPSLVEQVAGDGEDVLAALEEAAAAGFLVEEGSTRWAFAHGIVRDVTYAALSGARRARMHEQVGVALEGLPADEERLAALARHFSEAGDADRASRYSLLLGRQALDRLAYEEAVANLERGLAAAEQLGKEQRGRRADLALVLAEAHSHLGAWEQVPALVERAAMDARAEGDGRLLARAAVLATRTRVVGSSDPASEQLAREALDALGDSDPLLRALVLATGAEYPTPDGPDVVELDAMTAEALALARAGDDPLTLVAALRARGSFLEVTGRSTEQRDLVAEGLALGRGVAPARARVGGTAFLPASLLVTEARTAVAVGDRPAFDAAVSQLRAVGDELGGTYRTWTTMLDAVACFLDGRFADGEALADTYLAGLVQPDANALNVWAGQILVARREQGRLGEMLPVLVDAVDRNPDFAAFRAALAVAHAELGDTAAAAETLATVVPEGLRRVPRDLTWSGTMALFAETAARLGDAGRAGALYGLLREHSGVLLVIGETVGCLGAADRYLGMLAAASRDHQRALHHYRAALAAEERLGGRPLTVRTGAWMGRSLLALGDPEAGRVLDAAASDAQDLGMGQVAAEIAGLRA